MEKIKPKFGSLKRSIKLTNETFIARLMRAQITKIRNESGDITTNLTE